jgi:uroporphyrinogen decarboxylase
MGVISDFILSANKNVAMPIAVYPGVSLTTASIREVVTNPQAQFEAQERLHRRYETWIVQSAMDLSVEAEAFGSDIHITDNEIPTVHGRLVTNEEQINCLIIPKPGKGRTGVYLDTVRMLAALETKPLVLGGMIGPFSLAGRLFGVSEALEITMTESCMLHTLLEKCTAFLITYAEAYKTAGAHGILIAEPSAGLLSPRSLSTFSSAYIKRIVDSTGRNGFDVILHNCAARIAHIPAILESGAGLLHFGAPMDIAGALEKVSGTTVVFGNLDPAGVFVNSSEDEIFNCVTDLLRQTGRYRNFVLSSGCDVPPGTAIEKLDALYRALDAYNRE